MSRALSKKTKALAIERNVSKFYGKYAEWMDMMAPIIVARRMGLQVLLVYRNEDGRWKTDKVVPIDATPGVKLNSIFCLLTNPSTGEQSFKKHSHPDGQTVRGYLLESEVEYES